MTESEVWKYGMLFLQQEGFTVHCGSPPGATSYMYKNCILGNNGMVDAPDIVFSRDGIIYLSECKPTFSDLYKMNLHKESDIDKLIRLILIASKGLYDAQLTNNLEILLTKETIFRPCVSYHSKVAEPLRNFAHLVVGQSGKCLFEYQT